MKIVLKNIARKLFEAAALRLESDHKLGFRILAKLVMRHRYLMGGAILANLGSALCEGGTMGLLAIAVSILIANDAAPAGEGFASVHALLVQWLPEMGREGIFLVLVFGAIAAQITKSALSYIGKLCSIRLQFCVSGDLQARATRHVMNFSYPEIGRHAAGVLSTSISMAGQFSGLTSLVNTALLSAFMLFSYVGVMIVMSLPLTFAAMVVVTLLSIGLTVVVRRLNHLGIEIARTTIYAGRIGFELLQVPRLLRVFGVTDYAARAVNDARQASITVGQKAATITSLVDPLVDVITVIGAGSFLVVGFILAGESATTVIPQLLLFLLLLNRMMPQVKALNQVRMAVSKMLATVKTVAAFLKTEDKQFAKKDGVIIHEVKSAISFDNVCFSYIDSEVKVLSNITFAIKRGQTVALVGPSGAGKSTIIDLIMGLQTPTNGSVSVDGVNMKEINPSSWINCIGTVDQEVTLLNRTVFENISFASDRYSRADVVDASIRAQADVFINALPEGYDTIVGDRGFKLSGGQQQRLSLARALVRDPEILILDEATSSLDTESERLIQSALTKVRNNCTVIVIAHRLSTLVDVDEIIVVEKGRIIEQGDLSFLRSSGGYFSKLWGLQAPDQTEQ